MLYTKVGRRLLLGPLLSRLTYVSTSLVWLTRGSQEGSVTLYVTEELLSVEVEGHEQYGSAVTASSDCTVDSD